MDMNSIQGMHGVALGTEPSLGTTDRMPARPSVSAPEAPTPSSTTSSTTTTTPTTRTTGADANAVDFRARLRNPGPSTLAPAIRRDGPSQGASAARSTEAHGSAFGQWFGGDEVSEATTAGDVRTAGSDSMAPAADIQGITSRIKAEYRGWFAAAREKEAEFRRSGLKENDPEVRAHRQERMEKLFEFQTRMQEASFEVELIAKVAEHSTSATRTVLQTQT